MSPVDHLLVVGFVVVWPIVGLRGYRKFLREVAAGVPGVRAKMYLRTLAVQWLWAGGVSAWWLHEQRALPELGLAFGTTQQAIGGAVGTALVLGFLLLQSRRIRELAPERLTKLKASLGDAAAILPTDERELWIFRALAVTAGVCEEILFRGYLIWYLVPLLGQWPGMFAGAALFGAAHFYQGTKGVLKTGFIGVVMGALYLATGSLVWPMVLHAAVDLQAGEVGRALQRGLTAR
jgi:membrane protease YdiL (CAAX protease family)